MNTNFIWSSGRLFGKYLLIALRILPLLYLAIQLLSDIAIFLLLPIFGEKEIFFRATLLALLLYAFIEILSLRLLDRLNKIIWFEAQGREYWIQTYKMYKYLFLMFGLINLFIGSCIYLRLHIEGIDWFFYRENLFLGFIVILCLAPMVQAYRKYK